jgi:hypothetical protein
MSPEGRAVVEVAEAMDALAAAYLERARALRDRGALDAAGFDEAAGHYKAINDRAIALMDQASSRRLADLQPHLRALSAVTADLRDHQGRLGRIKRVLRAGAGLAVASGAIAGAIAAPGVATVAAAGEATRRAIEGVR